MDTWKVTNIQIPFFRKILKENVISGETLDFISIIVARNVTLDPPDVR